MKKVDFALRRRTGFSDWLRTAPFEKVIEVPDEVRTKRRHIAISAYHQMARQIGVRIEVRTSDGRQFLIKHYEEAS